MNIKLLLTILIILNNCTPKLYRINKPKNPNEEKAHAIVALAIYIVEPGEKSQIAKIFNTDDLVYALNVDSQKIGKIENVDKALAKAKTITHPAQEPVLVGKEEKNEIYNTDRISFNLFSVYSFDDSKNTYVFEELTYVKCKTVVRFVNGVPTTQRECNSFTLPVDPFTGVNSLPIKPKAGEIQFLGLYQARLIKSVKEDPYARTFDLSALIGGGEYKRINIIPDDGFILKTESKELIENYYGTEEKTPKGLEINFLKKFISIEVEGYWKEKAEKKLNKLLGKK